MKRNKINIVFNTFTLRKAQITSIINKCVNGVLVEEGVNAPCEINVLVSDDRGIQAINNATRNIDAPTDVLSYPMFPMDAGRLPDHWDAYLDAETGLCPLGDMVISLERAVQQAKEFGHSIKREVGYLTIHSMLHLLGYDHLDEGEQKAQMRQREEYIASKIGGIERNYKGQGIII